MLLSNVKSKSFAARNMFLAFVPGPVEAVNIPLIRRIWKIVTTVSLVSEGISKRFGPEFCGTVLAHSATSIVKRPVKSMFKHIHWYGRSWIDTLGKVKMTVMYHDAFRAGKHLDVHIGHLSIIYKVKPDLAAKIKYNHNGLLTQSTKDAIIKHISGEIEQHARVPQNADHSITNASFSWPFGSGGIHGYGAGATRQEVYAETVEVYKRAGAPGRTLEIYAPSIWKHGGLYLHKLYPGSSKRAPILIFGRLRKDPGALEDRLHLRMFNDFGKFFERADKATINRKYDGAATYIVSGRGGTTLWSPRVSKETGSRIEYTYKVPGVAEVRSPIPIKGMGELLFRDSAGNYLPAATVGGLLNADSPIPSGVYPELRVYRVDRFGRRSVYGQEFFANRALQRAVTWLHPTLFKLPRIVGRPISKREGWEGLVAVPKGESIVNGYKAKWCDDPEDWKFVSSELYITSKGAIGGVCWFENPEGRMMKLGPGQIGGVDNNLTIIDDPNSFVGRHAMVESRVGHSGRAAKMIGWHNDK